MIFGRSRRQKDTSEDEALSPATPVDPDQELDEEGLDELDPDADLPEEADPAEGGELGEPVDHELRSDGPFDITEVDLEADDVERLDFGAVVLTPFEGMQVQLQLDQETNQVQTALVMHERSALEVALFAAPATTSMVMEVADQMVENTAEQGGTATMGEGPFGPEVRREIPVTGDEGQQGVHISRTWLAQGPRWLLRGVLMGEAAMAETPVPETTELFLEFFRNIVVRRHQAPMVPGDVIPMTLPESMVPEAMAPEGLEPQSPELESPELESPELESPELESPEEASTRPSTSRAEG